MYQYPKLAEKVLVLGIDGMDPRQAKKFADAGVMPNLKKMVERGAAREDLVMLGGVPTGTPSMWTTLATGALPSTHGITDFWCQDHNDLDRLVFGLNSNLCQSEQLWNVTAEGGLKTLVWHWPGSSWPPSSDSENLHVVGGTNLGSVNQDVARVDSEKMYLASEAYTGTVDGAGCIPGDADQQAVQIKDATGWANAPAGAKEATLILSDGLVRRMALILKNEKGIYDRIAVYKSKKNEKPIFTVTAGEFYKNYVDECVKADGRKFRVNRSVKLVEMAENGASFSLWMSFALDMNEDRSFSPKSLYQDVMENVGPVQPVGLIDNINPKLFQEIVAASWDHYVGWTADALHYLVTQRDYSVVFSHLHYPDALAHRSFPLVKPQENRIYPEGTEKENAKIMEHMYRQTDDYIGRFVHLLDEGWTVMIVSGHGLMAEKNEPHLIGETAGISFPVMKELGYTVLKKDDQGNDIPDIDWSRTRAVATGVCHIWINLKGRNHTGIVDPEDKYELECQIIDDLYNYRDPKTGKRVIALALRNRDAAVLGMDGPESGDIVFCMEERFDRIHDDALPTQREFAETSVSPIFVSAGKGIRNGLQTKRVIRIADVVPTIAVLLGVRMPAQCEGAPVYQIIDA